MQPSATPEAEAYRIFLLVRAAILASCGGLSEEMKAGIWKNYVEEFELEEYEKQYNDERIYTRIPA